MINDHRLPESDLLWALGLILVDFFKIADEQMKLYCYSYFLNADKQINDNLERYVF